MKRILSLVAFIFLSIPALAGQTLPFTKEENADGAKFVWFVYKQTKHDYEYAPADVLPKSPHFILVEEVQAGDVAYWPQYVAIVYKKDGKIHHYITAEAEVSPEEMESLHGKPHFYRYVTFEQKP